MRADFIRMTSSTGGTSTLTCSAQTGYPALSKAFTGTRLVDYTIAEYTSSAKTQLSKAETGVGSYNTSTEVLTRTKILSTWDGTTYLPNPGSATAPTALSFGTTSANIDIMIGPTASTGQITIPFVMGSVASVASGLGLPPLNQTNGTTASFGTGTVFYWPVFIANGTPISKFTIRETTSLTGGTPTVEMAIYEVASDGSPGKRLIAFGTLTPGTANTTYTSAPIATPVSLAPGWYWAAYLYVANGATGSLTLKTANILGCSPQGALMSNTTASVGSLAIFSQTALSDPAAAPTAAANAADVPFVLFG